MPINQDMLQDIKSLYAALHYMYQQHKCGCGNPACNRCVDDSDNGQILHEIGLKYHKAYG